MKDRFSTFGSVALIAISTLLGTIAATCVPSATRSATSVGLNSELDVRAAQALTQGHSQPSRSAEHLVQDPPQRTSFRPDFSSGLRRSNQRSNFFMLRAFHDAVGDSWKSTVRLSASGEQLALGAIVGSDGWIISKASELPPSADIICRLYDGSELAAQIVDRDVDLDLALLRIDRSQLPVVHWDASSIPDRGRWLATTDVKAAVPSAVGVVSAGAQKVDKARAVLGVEIVTSSEGAAVVMVLPGSGANRAGLQIGDSIYRVDGQDTYSREAFLAAVKSGVGGQVVKLSVNRADRKFETEGRLMDLAEELHDETEMEVNGPVSARASGFNRVFLHDTVLEPNQCGGPLVDLEGNVVGINIARAGRVSSYALPADVVKPVVESLIEQAKLVSRPVDSKTALRPIR